ncbi:MAG: efflux transporter outer membrane subunit [Kofleriaceae bacterium]
MKRALAMVLLAGCYSMAPAYERPASPVAKQVLEGGQGETKQLAVGEFVKEPKLKKIMGLVLANNRSLRQSALNIEAARQQYRIQRAAMYPSIDLAAAVTSTRSLTGVDNNTVTFTQYGVNVGLSNWEIDLFGRLKSLSDVKLQQFLASVETAKATRISLVAETASAYITLAADRSRLQIAQETMDAAKKSMDLTEALVGGGTSNRSDYWQAATVFQQARGDLATLRATIKQDKNALELLAGAPLGDDLIPDPLPDAADWFSDVPVGMSSDVLLNRPDVLAAEHDLMAANANIGAARAQFFPSLTLTASGGLASIALATLFTGPAAVFTLAPSLAMPLFRGGANRANLAYSKVEKEAMIAAYEYAIQSAFKEVADALATKATIQEQLDAQVALVDASQKAFDLSNARYKAGVDTFLATLVTERALYSAKSSLVSTQLAALGNRIALYRSLGGGLN